MSLPGFVYLLRYCLLNGFQGKNIIVFYGSQTGTAEEFANRLSKDAQRYGMKGMAADPEEYDMVIHNLWSSTPNNSPSWESMHKITGLLVQVFLNAQLAAFQPDSCQRVFCKCVMGKVI
jgi:hypothetical protein